MTRKHFHAIAAILANARDNSWIAVAYAIDGIQEELVDYFESQNPNFDRDRFNRAARGEEQMTLLTAAKAALAALETPGDLTPTELSHVIDDLDFAIRNDVNLPHMKEEPC